MDGIRMVNYVRKGVVDRETEPTVYDDQKDVRDNVLIGPLS